MTQLKNSNSNEQWKQIDIDGSYIDYVVSSLGRVYSLKTKKMLKPLITPNGYYRVRLYCDGYSKYKSIHRLVALSFLDNDEDKPFVNHIDGVKTNNALCNLEWVTESENNLHAYAHGLAKAKIGEESHFARYSKESVRDACELMESGMYTLPEISKLTCIPTAMLYLIRDRKSWVNVSKYFDVENCKPTKSSYNEKQIEHVYMLLAEDKLSIYEISDITGVKTSTIYNIIIGRNTKFNYFYDLYDISNYHPRKILPDINEDAKNDIIKLLRDGVSKKSISKYINEKYKYNIDRVLHFTNRLQNKLIRGSVV